MLAKSRSIIDNSFLLYEVDVFPAIDAEKQRAHILGYTEDKTIVINRENKYGTKTFYHNHSFYVHVNGYLFLIYS